MSPTASLVRLDVSCVLVVDDHRVFAEALVKRLRCETAIEHAQVAWTVEQARAAARSSPPDVVLVDPGLEGGAGLDLVRQLDGLPTRPRVVVLADGPGPSEHDGHVPEGCGWLSKRSSFEDLLRAMGATRQDPGLAEADGQPAGAPGGAVPTQAAATGPTDLTDTLTERQSEVLLCLLAGMTRAQVSTRLGLSPHTVRDHVRHLFRKMAVTSTADLLARARADEDGGPRRLRVVPDP